MTRAALALLALTAACASCDKRPDASAEGVALPQARGFTDAPDGPTVVVTVEAPAPALPSDKVVKLAIAKQVPWAKVQALLDKAAAAGIRAVPLVGDKWRVRGFVPSDELETEESIALTATSDGKSCVSPPGEPEAKCVQTVDKNHIDVAYTRGLVREAVTAYKIEDIDLEVPPDMQWQDVVRAVDAARTCCGGQTIRVKINPPKPPEPLPAE